MAISCSMDVTGGLKASARMLQEAESGVKQGAAIVQTTTTQKLLPAIRSKVSTATAKGLHTLPSDVDLSMHQTLDSMKLSESGVGK